MNNQSLDPKDTVIVIVQGSFQTPLMYQQLADGLNAQGYLTYHPELQTCSNTDDPTFPSKTLDDDTEVVRKVVERLVKNEAKTVVVAMHSYGGLVGSNAIEQEMSFSYRKSQGLAGGVIHLFYFAAFILDKQQSVLGAFGESPNNDVRDDGRFYLKNGASLLYNDLPAEEAAKWGSRLIPQSHAVQKTEITCTAYKYILSTYLICENDKAAPPQYQEMFAGTAGSKIVKCSSGHSPMLSQPEMLVNQVILAVKGAISEID